MESLPVLLEGKKCGELLAEERGLYIFYRAVCDLKADIEPMRLFVVGEQGELRLGVIQPENGKFILCRQISARETAAAGRILRCELRSDVSGEPEWERVVEPEKLFRDPALKRHLRNGTDVLIRRSSDRCFVALPFDVRRPFPMTDLFCLARVRRIRQRPYAVFCFDRQEKPEKF